MAPKPLTSRQKAEMRSRSAAGESKKAIAESMNLAHETVVRNTPRQLSRTLITAELIHTMEELVKSGKIKREIAQELSVSRGTVIKYTRHLSHARLKLSPEQLAEASQLALAGESMGRIARKLGVSRFSANSLAQQALRGYQLSEEQRSAIQVERSKGHSLEKIATELAIPFIVIRNTLGINNFAQYPDEVRLSVIRAMESGEKSKVAGARYKVNWKTALGWFREAVARGEARDIVKPLEKGDDFQFTWITRLDPAFEEWRQLTLEWVESERVGVAAVMNALSAFFNAYLIKYQLPKSPVEFLQRGRQLPDFYEVACPQSEGGRRYNSTIFKFIEWVLDSPSFADSDGGEAIRLTELYRNPINPNAGAGEPSVAHTESTKVVLPYFLIADLRKRIVQGPNFRDWTWVQGLGGYETVNGQAKAGDWYAVSENQIDRNDPDCVFRVRRRVGKPPVIEMWSPARWVHALFHLQTTTRSGQARMLDSGEADTFIWKDGQFVVNPGPLKQGTARKPRQQGAFRRPSLEDASQGAQVSIYFNSNKTHDRGKSGASKGFDCPWPPSDDMAEDPYYWLVKLRDWQMKYNPIKRLTKWNELKGQAKLSVQSAENAEEYPDAAFLFRSPENAKHPSWPIKSDVTYRAWLQLLTAYEAILATEGIKHPSGHPIELINPENGLPWSSPHATRTSLITHLIMDGDVPPLIMMKIAGHSRFIMTIYYTKAGLVGIQNAIRAGTEKMEAAKYQSFERDLLSAKAEQLRDKIVFNAEDWKTVLPTNISDRNPLGWMHLHDGICLAGGNTGSESNMPGCHNGSLASIPRGNGRREHGPVPGGVRNCTRCRWKASGKQHILGLAATYDNRAYHMHKAKDEAIAAERLRNRLMQDKARVETSNEPFTRMRELIDAERRYEKAMQKFQDLALDVSALHRTIERVMTLPELVDGPTALAVQGDQFTVNMIVEDTDSELLQLATICADVELFPDLDGGTAIFEFSQLLDHAFEREGQPLILARLSENEKLAAANAIMRELERKAHPDNPAAGRRMVVDIMDRGESLEKMLGIKLSSILRLASDSEGSSVSLRLLDKGVRNDDDRNCAS